MLLWFLEGTQAVPPVFLSGRPFLFLCRRKNYLTLTMLAIGAALSFQNLYGGVAECVILVGASLELFLAFPGKGLKERLCAVWLVNSVIARHELFPLVGFASVFRQKHRDHMGDIATSVHKIPSNEKNL
ncbi:hypothetical protein [Pseudomonas viridiflava]|uniref:hypothetical protein n=1 Tax=Pseudomonas viridiflava TaxID=33069 RepID=UPI001C31D8D6|nr:hypothetical protein [Pseudomonas viridiflava]QXG42434.1 hypothetical protein KTT55_08040 [Pseudomonas viridiflava]